MSTFEDIADQMIEKAIKAGEWDDLPGKGKPLDQTDYLTTPESQRMGMTVLKNSGFKPPEAEQLAQTVEIQEQIQTTTDPEKLTQLRRQLITLETEIALSRERRKSH